MENYKIFNKAIHDHFFGDAQKGDYILFPIDEVLINSLCKKNGIDRKALFDEIRQLFKNDWSFCFSENKINIPNFFGFIGIQINAAHLMHSDNQYSASAYNPRLCEQLQIEISRLQILYSRFQDKLWQGLRQWCEMEGYYIHLPRKKRGKGCYIQYPISQALLNVEDLKKIPLLFEKSGLKPFEQISFEDFNTIVSNSDNGGFLTRHYYKLKEQFSGKNESEILGKQIYSFYLKWDGRLPSVKMVGNKSVEITDKISAGTLILRKNTVSSSKFDLFIFDENENIKYKTNGSDKLLFKKINAQYRLPHKQKNLITFMKTDNYDDDWEESRFLEFNTPCLLLFKNNMDFLQDYLHLLDKDLKKTSSESYSLFELNIKGNKGIKQFYKFLFSESKRPFSVRNGLKITRKSWMFGAGPDLVFEKPVRAWLNGKEISIENLRYSCRDHLPDKYTLKISDHAPFTFFIVEPHRNSPTSYPGWKVTKKEAAWEPYKKNHQISGLNFYFLKEKNISEHREWIDAILGRKKKKQISRSLVVNALQRVNKC